MKKIGKLSINPEKVIKNDELVHLKGGYQIPPGCSSQCSGTCNTPDITNGKCTKITEGPFAGECGCQG